MAMSTYDGVNGSVIKSIFRTACLLRFSSPQVDNIISRTGTALDSNVVSAILEGALRLLPPNNTLEGTTTRKAIMALKAEQASAAEAGFVAEVKRVLPELSDEQQQKEQIRTAVENGAVAITKSTPDILFTEPTNTCGVMCKWIEYKNMFGFKSNPFVHKKHRAQLRRYVEVFGHGMVVYKLGYESGLFSIAGLKCYREAEILLWLRSKGVYEAGLQLS